MSNTEIAATDLAVIPVEKVSTQDSAVKLSQDTNTPAGQSDYFAAKGSCKDTSTGALPAFDMSGFDGQGSSQSNAQTAAELTNILQDFDHVLVEMNELCQDLSKLLTNSDTAAGSSPTTAGSGDTTTPPTTAGAGEVNPGHFTTNNPPKIGGVSHGGDSNTGSNESGDGDTSDIKLSSAVQGIVNNLGLKANYSGSVTDNVTGYSGSGTTAKALSVYGKEDSDGGFTINNDPSHWGGDLAPKTSATGDQVFVADIKYNPNTIGKATFDGGKMTSWPAVWGFSGENASSTLNQEVDAMEDFGPDNGSKQGGSTLHNWTPGKHVGSTSESATIPTSEFADADTTGIEVAAVIDKKDDTISTYVDGKESASWKVAANSPALNTPMNWIMGTGNGEDMDVTNMQLYTASGTSSARVANT